MYYTTKKPNIIFFEGVSNVGKTTLLNSVKEDLIQKGHLVFVHKPSYIDDLVFGQLDFGSTSMFQEHQAKFMFLIYQEMKQQTIRLIHESSLEAMDKKENKRFPDKEFVRQDYRKFLKAINYLLKHPYDEKDETFSERTRTAVHDMVEFYQKPVVTHLCKTMNIASNHAYLLHLFTTLVCYFAKGLSEDKPITILVDRTYYSTFVYRGYDKEVLAGLNAMCFTHPKVMKAIDSMMSLLAQDSINELLQVIGYVPSQLFHPEKHHLYAIDGLNFNMFVKDGIGKTPMYYLINEFFKQETQTPNDVNNALGFLLNEMMEYTINTLTTFVDLIQPKQYLFLITRDQPFEMNSTPGFDQTFDEISKQKHDAYQNKYRHFLFSNQYRTISEIKNQQADDPHQFFVSSDLTYFNCNGRLMIRQFENNDTIEALKQKVIEVFEEGQLK